ncbi:MAG: hypothetical protein JSU06_05030 [Actinobacteria bacterium]|nr:hypothetical protein [Actinomycetota bacterium]
MSADAGAGRAMTVLGPTPVGELGLVSMHEHVLADSRSYLAPAAERARWAPAGEPLALANQAAVRRDFGLHEESLLMDDAALAATELAALREAGGGAVVEMSTPGLRTDVAALPEVSRRSGVHIVVGTGLYVGASRPPHLRGLRAEALAAWMVGEIREGIGETGIRAGHIGELGITDLDESDRTLLKAAALAAGETGCAISIHPGFEPGSDGRAIADVLERAGAAPDRVVMGHGDAFLVEHDLMRLLADPTAPAVRLDYHRELLERGYNVAIDCFGHDWAIEREDWVMEGDWHRLAAVATLVGEGHAPRLVLGCDIFMRPLLRRGGGLGYARLLDWALPALRRAGVAERDIRQMMVDNPARLLGVF